MKEKTCCFSGHRHIPVQDRKKIICRLEETIVALYHRSIRYYGAGGALGFDTLAAEIVIKLREKYSDIKLILVLPCLSQTRGWKTVDIMRYEKIKSQANKVVYTSWDYTKNCMHKRNRHLVDNSSVCVCYQTKYSGGTAYTVNYAKTQGLDVINLASY